MTDPAAPEKTPFRSETHESGHYESVAHSHPNDVDDHVTSNSSQSSRHVDVTHDRSREKAEEEEEEEKNIAIGTKYSDTETVRRRLRVMSEGKGKERMKRVLRHDQELVPEDDTRSTFFAKGRDFASVYTNHRYTEREREVLESHDSFDYLPSHSTTYKQWLIRQPARLDWDRWLTMGLIGVTIGCVGILLHQFLLLLSSTKWETAERLMHEHGLMTVWLWVVGFSVIFAAFSSASVAFIYPPSGGSGIPEVIGFLNGTVMRHVLNLPAFCVKFVSCVCAVGAGLPVGPEGPMIHMGSIVGTGISQFRSKTLRFTLPFFARFRNSEDRRNFTTAGAAAGVAAAFGAPVGGLLFAMEEVSSFWTMRLGWMIFFCCMLATFTADIVNSSFDAFHFKASFGLFEPEKFIVLKVGDSISVNVLMFLPAACLGIIGGLLGAVFTISNLKISRLRRRLLSRIRKPIVSKFLRFVEPPIIMVIWSTITVFLPSAFPCRAMVCPSPNMTSASRGFSDDLNISSSSASSFPVAESVVYVYIDEHRSVKERVESCPEDGGEYKVDSHVQHYWCQKPTISNGVESNDGQYNEVASLLNVNGHRALQLLYSRRTHFQFNYACLLSVLPVYFVLACWTAGSAVASGIVVPMLFIGGLYGRMIGRLLVDFHGGIPKDPFWHWIDPGAMALIGSASFFGGVSRLTVSLTVIMIEITNDVAFLLPIMVSIMVSKWVGDYITHPLYHSQLELKCIPFLDAEPVVYNDRHQILNLELFKARDVMQSPVITISPRESVAHLAHLLLETTHGGFPVVKYFGEFSCEVAYGLLTRLELCIILSHEHIQKCQLLPGSVIVPQMTYEQVSGSERDDADRSTSLVPLLEKYLSKPVYASIYVDLDAFVNRSAPRIEEEFSLHRTYIIFRTLGLRHLVVVDMVNRVVGIITRKDLMGFSLEERLERRKRRGYSVIGGMQKTLPSEELSSAAQHILKDFRETSERV